MKTTNANEEQNLNPWQHRAIVALGAVIGGAVTYYVLRWIGQRKKGVASDTAVPPQPDPGKGEV